MMFGVFLWLICLTLVKADTSGHPPPGTCLCCTESSVNVRDGPCGNVIGTMTNGQCFTTVGNKAQCSLSGTLYEFLELEFSGEKRWAARNYMRIGSDIECGINLDEPTEEFRSFFIATVYNIDWPSSSSSSSSVQQQEMIDYLNIMEDINMNALLLQVRTSGDAFYDSSYEPWSRYLTGTQGTAPNPYYDPLEFTIVEAHARNIEVHAWLNPYRANMSPNTDDLHSSHMCYDSVLSQHCHEYSSYMWMDPGADEVIDHLVNVITDIINRYDVDGIHFDDYFYPYPDGTDFPDSITWNRYLGTCGGSCMSRDDWRRDNVNRMVERVYNQIKQLRPSVVFSISPFGIYRPGHEDGMPPHICCFDPYEEVYADSKWWLQQAWIDILAPQLYWAIDPPEQSYPTLLDWWLSANNASRHVDASNGVYRIADSNDWPVSEIENQIEISRSWRDRLSLGNVHFSAKYFRDNTKGITDVFRDRVYTQVATTPEMPWLPGKKPEAPMNLKTTGISIKWDKAIDRQVKSWLVYKRESNHWEILKLLNRDTNNLTVEPGTYAVRAVSRHHGVSDPAFVSVVGKNRARG